MFIGHFAVALGAKKIVPSASLGTTFLAAQFADLLWPTFVLLGLESFAIRPGATVVTPLEFVSYPYSHSLLALIVWGVVIGLLFRGRQRRSAAIAALAVIVVSHWVLDVVTHKPDMPLAFDGPRFGLGLWNSRAATVVIEGALFSAGVGIYATATRARDRAGALGLWALVGFLIVVYFVNLFGPPPPSVAAVVWSAQAMWLLVAWGYWTDRHRMLRTPPEPM